MMSVDDRHFIAFRTVFPLPPNLYIDNVMLRKKSLCPRVLNLHLEAVSTSSIIVAWDNPPDTLPVPSYYEIVVQPEGGDSAITITATHSPVTISGLNSISGYWLKSVPIATVSSMACSTLSTSLLSATESRATPPVVVGYIIA